MGISLRVFLVDEDDSINRFALSRYLRLRRHDPDESLPQYAGKRVRFALAAVDLVDRKPVEIIRTQFFWLSFDFTGRIDPAEKEKEIMLVMNSLTPISEKQESRKILDARHRFAKRRYQHEHLWKPSPEIQDAIFDAIFKNRKL